MLLATDAGFCDATDAGLDAATDRGFCEPAFECCDYGRTTFGLTV